VYEFPEDKLVKIALSAFRYDTWLWTLCDYILHGTYRL